MHNLQFHLFNPHGRDFTVFIFEFPATVTKSVPKYCISEESSLTLNETDLQKFNFSFPQISMGAFVTFTGTSAVLLPDLKFIN